jgi:hypothetical protein
VALQLFKLASESFPSLSAVTSQVAHAYFRLISANLDLSAGIAYSFSVSLWFNGDGTSASVFATGQGYNSLCINGVLQMPGLYSIGADAVVITPSSAWTLEIGKTITLQTYNANATVTYTAPATSLVAIP